MSRTTAAPSPCSATRVTPARWRWSTTAPTPTSGGIWSRRTRWSPTCSADATGTIRPSRARLATFPLALHPTLTGDQQQPDHDPEHHQVQQHLDADQQHRGVGLSDDVTEADRREHGDREVQGRDLVQGLAECR